MASYKLRKVPANWNHPKDNEGNYIPLFDGSYSEYLKEFEESEKMWGEGFMKDFDIIDKEMVFKWIPKIDDCRNYSYEEWHGDKRTPENYRPDWPECTMTHFQLYDNVTDGTPVSPVFRKTEDLARWLANNLNDERYPYTSIIWNILLRSRNPSIGIMIATTKQ